MIQAGGSVASQGRLGHRDGRGNLDLFQLGGHATLQQAGTVLTSEAGSEHVVDGGGLVVIKGGLVKIN
ncbi:MAG: hypothetical protein R2762_04185 [Bryobacteraceae bacterium]